MWGARLREEGRLRANRATTSVLPEGLVYLRIRSTDLNGLLCKAMRATHLESR